MISPGSLPALYGHYLTENMPARHKKYTTVTWPAPLLPCNNCPACQYCSDGQEFRKIFQNLRQTLKIFQNYFMTITYCSYYWCDICLEIVFIFWQLSQQQNIFYLEINFLMLNCWFEIVIKQKFIVRTSHRPVPEMGMLGEKSFTSILKYFRWPSGIRPGLARPCQVRHPVVL